MADNVTAPATGDTFATDEIAGVQYPRTKVGWGIDGAYVDVSAVNPLPVTLGLTDAQLRAAALPVSGPLTDAQLRAAALPVSGPLTDAQIRATALPVSGPLTDTQLRAAAVPVSAATLPLPAGAATEATLAALNAKVPAAGQALMAGSQPVAIASNQSPIPTVENATLLTGQAAQTAVVNNILPATAGASGTDVANLRAASVQVTSTGTGGTFIFEQSNDNVNWSPLPVFNAALVTGVPITAAITATASAIIYTFPLRCQFVRLRIATTITGGSIQAFSRFSSEPWTPAAALVAQPTAANLQATVAGTVTATVGTSISGGTISPLTVAGVTVEASAARTASGTGTTITNASAIGAMIYVNVTAASGTTPTLAVRVQVQDPVSLAWFDITPAVTTTLTGVSSTMLTLYPGISEVANARVSQPLPRVWRVAWTIGGTTPSFTFSVGAQYII